MRRSKLNHEGLTINLAGIPDGAILLIDKDQPCEEMITVESVISPIIDMKTEKIIKPGVLLGVKRNV